MAEISGVKYVMCPIDLFQETWYKRLRPRFPDLSERLFQLIILGQAIQPSNGRILGSRGTPLEADDIASRCGAWSEEESATWQALLDALVDVGIIHRHAEGGWEFACRSDWWRLAKETSEYQAAKKARQRAQANKGMDVRHAPSPSHPISPAVPPASPEVPKLSPTVPQESPLNTCIQESGKGKVENAIGAPPTPPVGGAGAGAGGNLARTGENPQVVAQCLGAARALHGQALPAKAEREIRDEVAALLQAGHPHEAIGAWCRQACEDLLRDPAGLNVPVYGIPRRMRQFSTAPPADAPALAGGAKPSRHPARCRCPVCGVVEDIVRWSLDQPDIANLEAGCRHFASKRFLPGLSGDQVLEGIIEALRLVDDVQPHVRSACRSLAERLGATKSFSASPDPGWSTPAEALLAEFESLPESEQADLLAIAWETMPAVARSLVSEGDRTDSGHPMVRGALLEVLGDRARASPVPA